MKATLMRRGYRNQWSSPRNTRPRPPTEMSATASYELHHCYGHRGDNGSLEGMECPERSRNKGKITRKPSGSRRRRRAAVEAPQTLDRRSPPHRIREVTEHRLQRDYCRERRRRREEPLYHPLIELHLDPPHTWIWPWCREGRAQVGEAPGNATAGGDLRGQQTNQQHLRLRSAAGPDTCQTLP